MRWTTLLATVIAINSFAPRAAAAPSAVESGKKGKKKKVAVKDDNVTTDEDATSGNSESVRAKKRFGAELQYTPVSDFVLKYGARAFFNVSSSLQLGLSYLGGSEDLASQLPSEGDVTVKKADLSGNAIFGYLRFFPGNTFSATIGLGYRGASAEYAIQDTSGHEIDGKLSISSIVIPIAVGNHWTWRNGFTLGCDWIAAFVPLSGSSKSTLSGSLTDADAKTLNDDFVSLGDKLAKQTTFTLLLTSVGFMF